MSRTRSALEARGGGAEITCQDVRAVHPGPARVVGAPILVPLTEWPSISGHTDAGDQQELVTATHTEVTAPAVLQRYIKQ